MKDQRDKNDHRETLVTLHGVYSTGAWQLDLDPILSHHFYHVPLGYPDFRDPLGAIRACLGLRAFLLGFAIAGTLGWLLVGAVVGVVAGSLVGLTAGVVWATGRRGRVVRSIEAQLDKRCLERGPPHLIAHSFGTYASSRALTRQPAIRFSRVVFVGSVVPRNFPFAAIIASKPRALASVRNEMGFYDWVSFLAGSFGLFNGMGASGWSGFYEVDDVVHTVEGSWGECNKCKKTGSLVHNVKIATFDHNDMFHVREHAVNFWLPFLWNISPKEYDHLIHHCRAFVKYLQQRDLHRLARVEAAVGRRIWSWCRLTQTHTPTSLEEGFRTLIRTRLKQESRYTGELQVNRLTAQAVARFCQLIAEAYRVARDPTADPELAKCLHPYIAMLQITYLLGRRESGSQFRQ